MSLHSVGFIKELAKHLGIEGEVPPDVQFVEGGYLFLASEGGEQTLRENFKTQRFVVHLCTGKWDTEGWELGQSDGIGMQCTIDQRGEVGEVGGGGVRGGDSGGASGVEGGGGDGDRVGLGRNV